MKMEKELTPALSWSFLENLNEGLIVTDETGRMQYLNPAARRLLGVRQAPTSLRDLLETTAVSDDWQRLLHPPATVHISRPGGNLTLEAAQWEDADQTLIQIMVDQTTASHANLVLDQLSTLIQISGETNFDKKLQRIVDGLQATGWQRVVLTLRDEDLNPTKMISAGFTAAEEAHLEAHLLPADTWQTLFLSEAGERFRHGACYFVPGDSAWSRQHFQDLLASPPVDEDLSPETWRPRDVLSVPLYDREQKIIGLLGLDQPQNGRRPDAFTLQTVELYARFAATAIENARLVRESLDRTRELESLFAASRQLSNTLEKDGVLALMSKHLQQAIGADGYVIYQWRETEGTLQIIDEQGPDNGRSRAGRPPIPFSSGETAVGQALTARELKTEIIAADAPLPAGQPPWIQPDTTYTRIIIPIELSISTFGAIELIKSGEYTLSENDRSLLTALSNQANTSLETALVFEETIERERFYNALGSVNLALNDNLELDTVLNLICTESLRIFDTDGAYIWLREEDKFVGAAARGHAEEEFTQKSVSLDATDVFVISVVHNGQATYLNDLSQVADVHVELPQPDSIQAVLGVPLEQEGEIAGVLILVDRRQPYRFSAKDVSQATVFGVQAAIALQNAKLFAELRQLNEELDLRVARRTKALHEESNRVKILLRITTELSASLDQDRVLNKALHLVNEVVNATQGAILLIDQETGELVFRAAFGTDRKPSPKGLPSGLMRDEGLAGWMIENRSSVIVHDTRDDPRWVERPTSKDHRSVLAVPLMTGEEVIGVLMLFHDRPNAFTMQQLDLVEAAAVQVANAINNANLYLLIRDQAERLGKTLHLEQIETAKNQAILESIADGVIVADEHNTITLANMPASSILDIPREELIGKSINQFLGLYGQTTEQSWLSTINDWSENADRIEQWTYLDAQLSIEDKFVSLHLSPVLAGKQFFGTVSIFRDITKEVELDRLKSEFVSTVSHELRTPMTSIKGYVDLLLMGAAGQMSDAQTRYLQVIQNNAERLHMLVNDLLDISRIETGKTKLDLRPVDISQLIEDVVEGHLRGRIQHENKNITVYTDTPNDLPLVNIDHARITQVLTNLLDNAFNYTPANGEIHVIARANGDSVHVSVKDTGIGIAKENQNKIFDRFYRAENDDVQQIPGTGLGLSIVHSLVEMHNGDLTLQSEPGKGSTFSFNLPIVVEDEDET